MQDLSRVLERLVALDLKLAPKKAHLGIRVGRFVGHCVTAHGLAPDPRKVEALTKMLMPTSVSQLCYLLGGLSYYREFLPLMTAKTRTLNALFKKGVKLSFTPEQPKFVQHLLQRLVGADVLAFPDFEAVPLGRGSFGLITDASVDGLGAITKQN